MRIDLQPGYVLHSRPYRDSSALVEVFTAEYGRISLVARGARRQSRKGSGAALLQPFVPLLVSFSGRAELKNLVAVEPTRGMLPLRAARLYSGLYVNELLIRLLHRNDAHPRLFAAYDEVLHQLVASPAVDAVLRQFEFTLLEELGYSVDPGLDGVSGRAIDPARWYLYEPGVGLVAVDGGSAEPGAGYRGADLLAIKSGDLGGTARHTAKRLLREALAVHLGGTPLRSRELFRAAAPTSPRKLDQKITDT